MKTTTETHPMPNHVEQTARQERLELLYRADGRDSPDHPHYQLFTGLWQQHMDQQEGIIITTEEA
jgi:hypothetical protein